MLFAIAAVALSTRASATGQTSPNFMMHRDAINAGVADMASVNFRVAASVGDAVASGRITSVSFQLSSGFRGMVEVSTSALNLLSVVSRKLHGATPFEIMIDKNVPTSGLVTVEPRVIGSGHTLVFRFDSAVTSIGAVTALDALANALGTVSALPAGNDAIVSLSNLPDNKRVMITLTGLNGAGTASASVGFLVGDVNGTRSVNSSDISGVKARSGQVTGSSNFRFDVNASGAVNASDISAVKARSGLVLP